MSSQFRVCTYNMGKSRDDYFKLCKYQNPSLALGFESRKEELAFSVKYACVEKSTSFLLSNSAHVYCLQEVGSEQRPLLDELGERFTCIHFPHAEFDTAIALDTHRFEAIENHSMHYEGMDVAIAIATDRVSKQRFTFVSAHVPGYDLSDADPQEIAPAVDYCKAISKKLTEIAQGTIRVIGADMNAYPEIEQRRFQALSKEDCSLLRTHEPTNVNALDKDKPLRELDFFFASLSSLSLWERFKALFFSKVTCRAQISKVPHPVSWHPELNASDHLPIFVDFSVETTSKIKQLFSALCNYIWK